MSIRDRIHARTHHRGLHGHDHTDRQRRTALLMIITGLLRVAIWSVITVAFLFGMPTVVGWFGSVKFVSLLSILALVLTDWGQVAASLAQLTAGDAHHDVEHVRSQLGVDYTEIEGDIARLAELQPCPEADELARSIRARLAHGAAA
jgi:hypothetical protein